MAGLVRRHDPQNRLAARMIDFDNVGTEYHRTEPESFLSDKDVFYISVILVLVGILVGLQ